MGPQNDPRKCDSLRALLVAACVALGLASSCSRPEPLPVLADIQSFSLQAADGGRFDSKSLAGRPYVVSFFFTHCPSVCPKIMGAMAEVRDDAPTDLQLVSITVDPDNDTPERLTEYAASIGAVAPRWQLLTGTREELLAAVRGSFMTHMGEREEGEAGLYDIAHGARLMLVDGRSRLRAILDPAFGEHKSLKVMVEQLRAEGR